MVCGIDTFHEYGFPSVGGFVASIDTEFTKWFSRACIQEPRQELLDGLVHCFTTALQKYFNVSAFYCQKNIKQSE